MNLKKHFSATPKVGSRLPRGANVVPIDPVEFRVEKLKEIATWVESFRETVVTEADTRFKIIDRILTEALGWSRESIQTEESAGDGKLDYRLVCDSASRAIVEAKREIVAFGLKSSQSGQAYALGGTVLKAALEAIRQVIPYCAFKGAELACVTNGTEWIIFRANRLGDGMDILAGKGYVFASLGCIAENFRLFHDLLSYEAVQMLRFRGPFQEAEGLPMRDLSFFKACRSASSRRTLPRSAFAVDFDALMNSFFQRLKGEEDPEMIVKCFVVTEESELADRKLVRVAEELVDRLRTVDSETGQELLELIQSVRRHNQHRFALLVGTKGAGKSTFIDRFFRFVLPQKTAEHLVIVRLDLALNNGNENTILHWLNKHLLEECEKSVFTLDAPSFDETVGAMFWDEYQRWSRGTLKYLHDTDKNTFKIEFGRHVEKIRQEQPHDYIKRLIRHIVYSRKKIPCLILDNTDHYSISFQERVFQYARSIYESELCIVIIPITDRTSWQLSKQGALQSFESEVLYLPTPQPHRVIERRISFLLEKLDQEKKKQSSDYFIGRNIRLNIQDISAFAASLNRIFVETKNTSDWLGGLVNYDIRRLLELTKEVIASPQSARPRLFWVMAQLVHCQSILAVPFKRRPHRVPDYLGRSEIQSLFLQIDCQTPLGQRDDALLRLLYNTGMRAQELVDLDVNHLRFSRPYFVRIYGKGRKERTCQLWKETVDAVRKDLERRSVQITDAAPLFVNVEGNRLSRFGLRYIIAHRVTEAAKISPTLLTRRAPLITFPLRFC